MTVAELQLRMSSSEFTEWMAYERIDPFGADRDDLRMGIAVATWVNAQSKENQVTPRDFMPFMDEDEEEKAEGQDLEMQLRVVRSLNAAMGGAVTSGGASASPR
jgi:Protein of unknown function (DUF4035)